VGGVEIAAGEAAPLVLSRRQCTCFGLIFHFDGAQWTPVNVTGGVDLQNLPSLRFTAIRLKPRAPAGSV
jgi:hypothetical protein